MPRHASPEQRIVEYFETQPLEAARSILAVCQYTLARRTAAEEKPKPRAVKPRVEPPAAAANG